MERTSRNDRMRRLLTGGFTALDIAEPLMSFDAIRGATDVASKMAEQHLTVVGVRRDGIVAGFVQPVECVRQPSLRAG